MESKIKLLNLEKFKAKEKEIQSPEQVLFSEIRDVCRKIENAYESFEYEQDEDLMEAAIYEIEALKARYRYLLRIAKMKNMRCEERLVISTREWVADKMG